MVDERERRVEENKLILTFIVPQTLIMCNSDPEYASRFLMRPENWNKSEDGKSQRLAFDRRDDSVAERARVLKVSAVIDWMTKHDREIPLQREVQSGS